MCAYNETDKTFVDAHKLSHSNWTNCSISYESVQLIYNFQNIQVENILRKTYQTCHLRIVLDIVSKNLYNIL